MRRAVLNGFGYNMHKYKVTWRTGRHVKKTREILKYPASPAAPCIRSMAGQYAAEGPGLWLHISRDALDSKTPLLLK